VAGTTTSEIVAAVLKDWRTAPVSEKMRTVLGFLEKLTLAPQDIGPDDVAPMRNAGVSDKAIEEAIYVCFLFSVMDRLADALGFDIHSSEEYARGGQAIYKKGYSKLSLPW
jgi:alkylhydroperoxidase family enzyme